jgi:hypothetical protein
MSAASKLKQAFILLGFLGFLLSVWFAYQCGLGARHSANQSYTSSRNAGSPSRQAQAASAHNPLRVLAIATSVCLPICFLSTCLYSKRRPILRKGSGLIMLAASFMPFVIAYVIVSSCLQAGGTPPLRLSLSASSSGSLALHGWQVYAAGLLFSLAALSLILGGAYLLVSPSQED